MKVDIQDLRVVVNRLLDHISHTRGIREVELGTDFYWSVDGDLLYDMSKEPTDMSAGSLADDWQFASSLLQTANEPVAYQLTEVAPILRRIGEVLGEQLAAKGG